MGWAWQGTRRTPQRGEEICSFLSSVVWETAMTHRSWGLGRRISESPNQNGAHASGEPVRDNPVTKNALLPQWAALQLDHPHPTGGARHVE